MPLIGILGGTFDPIHNGHIRLALEAQQQLSLEHVRLIPVNIPPHRSLPAVSSDHRRKMIELAIANEKTLCIDLREMESDETSYTISTLRSLRQEFTDETFCLILGRDAFNKIDSWKDWEQLLDYAHIIVANRPGEMPENISTKLNTWINKHQTNQLEKLNEQKFGRIYFIDIPMLDVSSSTIRQKIKKDETTENLLATTTHTYIKENNLYMDTA